jgi:S-DNA-T family DNA segregation ATPase FtsK/SpoIIIE
MQSTVRRPRRVQDAPSATHERRPLTDFTGISLIGLGALLFLALVSYSPDDIPSWVSFSRRPAADVESMNLMGPIGAIVAGYAIFLLGAAAFFLPIGLIWLGMAKIIIRLRLTWPPVPGLLLMLACMSTLLAIQTFAFEGWDYRFQVLGAGGGIGHVGQEMANRTVGRHAMGALCVLGILIGAVMLFGLRPVQALHMAQGWLDRWREDRILARKHAASEDLQEEQAALEAQRQAARQARQENRTPRRRQMGDDGQLIIPGREVAAALSEPELGLNLNSGMAELEAFGEPPVPLVPAGPEIIDGTARKSESDDPVARKLSLAEWREQRQKPKPTTTDAAGAPSGMASALTPLSEAFKDYELPDLDLLHWDDEADRKPADKGLLLATQQTIIRTLGNFGVAVTPGTITRGPSITRYEIYPTDGLRVAKIVTLEPDLARATKAEFINILAPIPGKDTVGIEIANSDKVPVPLRELLEDPKFHKGKARIPLALGKDVYGETIIADLAAMPHLLVAGTTGSGKSVCINSIIASLLFQFGPDQMRFIMVDPKVVEMQMFNDLPHLIVPVVTDPKKVLAALKWVVNEMDHRYRIFAKEGVRNFEGFNNRKRKSSAPIPSAPPKRSGKRPPAPNLNEPELPLFDSIPEEIPAALTTHPVRLGGADEDPFAFIDDSELASRAKFAAELGQDVQDYYEDEEEEDYAPKEDAVPDTVPYIVVIIDELADLMQTASADVENLIARITQKARAAGIHLIVATQTPRANVITGVIKANIPSRIAFQVASGLDSRVILDTNGAEKLVGKGDMLYLPPGSAKHTRVQGAFITDEEMQALVDHCKDQGKPMYDASVQASIREASDDDEGQGEEDLGADDEALLEKCIEVIIQEKIASTSRLQRRLKLGYTRAARMMDILEKRGMVGPGEGAKPREILISPDHYAD